MQEKKVGSNKEKAELSPNAKALLDLATPKQSVHKQKPGVQTYLAVSPKGSKPITKDEMPSVPVELPYGINLEDGELQNLLITKTLRENFAKENKIPKELVGTITDEQWNILTESTYESCDGIYAYALEELNKYNKTMAFLNDPETVAFFPYCFDHTILKDVVAMTTSDYLTLLKDLKGIRSLYTEYLEADGKQKANVDGFDVFHVENILDIKERYMMFSTQAANLMGPNLRWLSDLYTSMKLMYFVNNPTDPRITPEVQKYIDLYLNSGINKEGKENDKVTSEAIETEN